MAWNTVGGMVCMDGGKRPVCTDLKEKRQAGRQAGRKEEGRKEERNDKALGTHSLMGRERASGKGKKRDAAAKPATHTDLVRHATHSLGTHSFTHQGRNRATSQRKTLFLLLLLLSTPLSDCIEIRVYVQHRSLQCSLSLSCPHLSHIIYRISSFPSVRFERQARLGTGQTPGQVGNG